MNQGKISSVEKGFLWFGAGIVFVLNFIPILSTIVSIVWIMIISIYSIMKGIFDWGMLAFSAGNVIPLVDWLPLEFAAVYRLIKADQLKNGVKKIPPLINNYSNRNSDDYETRQNRSAA